LYVIIIGLSGIGDTLARILVEREHSVAIIDKNEERCKKFASEVGDSFVLHGEAEDNDNLRNAGAEKANALVAATGDDSVNLMMCTMAKEYGIPILVATVREPEHKELFRKLGAGTATTDEIAAEHLYQQLLKIDDVLFLGKAGGPEIFSVNVVDKSKAADKKIQDIRLPNGYQIIAAFQNKELAPFSRSLVLKPGDETIIYTTKTENIKRVSEIFTAKR